MALKLKHLIIVLMLIFDMIFLTMLKARGTSK